MNPKIIGSYTFKMCMKHADIFTWLNPVAYGTSNMMGTLFYYFYFSFFVWERGGGPPPRPPSSPTPWIRAWFIARNHNLKKNMKNKPKNNKVYQGSTFTKLTNNLIKLRGMKINPSHQINEDIFHHVAMLWCTHASGDISGVTWRVTLART